MPKKQADPIDLHVGSRLRARRLALGLIQQTLGAALGVTYQQVQKCENGSNRVGASRLQQVAPAHFFVRAPGQQKLKTTAPSAAPIFDFLATPEDRALAKAFGKIKLGPLRRHIAQLVSELTGG